MTLQPGFAIRAGGPADVEVTTYVGTVTHTPTKRMVHACDHHHETREQGELCAKRWIESLPKNPTDGFMRSMLDYCGVYTRGKKMSAAQLLKLCQEQGLPFTGGGSDE